MRTFGLFCWRATAGARLRQTAQCRTGRIACHGHNDFCTKHMWKTAPYNLDRCLSRSGVKLTFMKLTNQRSLFSGAELPNSRRVRQSPRLTGYSVKTASINGS